MEWTGELQVRWRIRSSSMTRNYEERKVWMEGGNESKKDREVKYCGRMNVGKPAAGTGRRCKIWSGQDSKQFTDTRNLLEWREHA